MKKRFSANLYTETKTAWNSNTYASTRNDDGTLFSCGRYKTKILPEDLPEWYVKGRYYKQFGYLSANGVKGLYYRPNFSTNHMFKDDFLFISYNRKIVPNQDMLKRTGDDEYIYGWEILSYLKAAEKYSGYDISEIKREIEKKRVWFKETYPNDYAHEVGASGKLFD